MAYELFDRGSFLHIRFFGLMESRDFGELFTELQEYEQDSATVRNRITTLSDIDDFIIQFSTMLPIAEGRGKKEFNPPIKSAVVASRPIEMVMASILESLNRNASIIIRVFSTVAEAEKWVSE
jgi:hypothetical protein